MTDTADPEQIAAQPESNTAGRHLGLALVVICSAQLMIVLDATVVNVALPTIHRDLHFSTANLEWLITAYSLTFGGLLVFGGRTGDLFGKRRMFMTGIAVFAIASLLGGLAQSDVWLIITRALQGVGAAVASPTALSLIATNFPEGQVRNRAMGVYAAMSGAGGAVGLLLGGVFTDLLTWRWIFFINVPIGALVLLLAPRALNESPTSEGRLDVWGAVTVTGGMLSLVYGISASALHGWGSPQTALPLIAAGFLLSGFLLIESRSASPLMPFSIFANRNRTAVYSMMLCIVTGMFSLFFFLSQFLQDVLGWSALKTGVGFLPMAFGIVVAAQVSSRIVGRIGIRMPLLVGPSSVACGFFWLSLLTVHSTYANIIGPILLISLGMGFTFVPLTLTAVSKVRPDQTGLASALLNTAQQVGGALGLAVLSTVAFAATKRSAASLAAANSGHLTTSAQAVATTHGYTVAFRISTCLVLVAVAISALVIRMPRSAIPGAATPAGGAAGH